MKISKTVVCLILAALSLAAGPAAVASVAPSWQIVAHNTMATIEVEPALYQQTRSGDFFVHIRVRNSGNSKFAFDPASSYSFGLADIFQGDRKEDVYNLDYRTGLRHMPTEQGKRNLLNQFINHNTSSLIILEKGKSYDYYRSYWNKAKVTDNKTKYAILMIDGSLPITDGVSVKVLQPVNCPAPETMKRPAYDSPEYWEPVLVPRSAKYLTVPDGANIFSS